VDDDSEWYLVDADEKCPGPGGVKLNLDPRCRADETLEYLSSADQGGRVAHGDSVTGTVHIRTCDPLPLRLRRHQGSPGGCQQVARLLP
jgi:hypothetical protein